MEDRMPLVANAVDFSVVFDIVRAAPPAVRADFVAAIVERVAAETAIGPGLVHRAAAEIAPRFVPPVADPRTGEPASRRRV
jgi:hypothetical protein